MVYVWCCNWHGANSKVLESFKNPKNYLRQVPPGSWSVDTVLKGYANHYSTLSNHDLLKKIDLDLEDTSKERPHQASAVRQWKSAFKPLCALLDRETKDTIVNTNKLSDTWDSHGSVTVHQTSVIESSKRKEPYDGLESLTVKKGRKHFDFTPQMKPSISTHKPRVSNEDQAQLSPLYAVKIHDPHAFNTPEVLVKKYGDNKDAQAGIQSLRKRPIALQLLSWSVVVVNINVNVYVK